jgi:hypothetical protein
LEKRRRGKSVGAKALRRCEGDSPPCGSHHPRLWDVRSTGSSPILSRSKGGRDEAPRACALTRAAAACLRRAEAADCILPARRCRSIAFVASLIHWAACPSFSGWSRLHDCVRPQSRRSRVTATGSAGVSDSLALDARRHSVI